ncbi:hypothetical protein BC828DRAFT_421151 [Blastocladiella britannica]|nr:hypothetical protein BC828DRAFT_421151 [Blastocladiella britannica]
MAQLEGESAGVWKDIGPNTILTQIADAHACFQCNRMGHEAKQCGMPRPAPRAVPQYTIARRPKPVPTSRITPSAMHQGHSSPVVGATWANMTEGRAPTAATPAQRAVSPRSAPSVAAGTTLGLTKAFAEMGAILIKQVMIEVRNGNIKDAQNALTAFDSYKAHMGVAVTDDDVAAVIMSKHPAPAPAATRRSTTPAPAPRQTTAPARQSTTNAAARRPNSNAGSLRAAKKARTTEQSSADAAAAIMALEAAATNAANRLAAATEATAAKKAQADKAKALLAAARAAATAKAMTVSLLDDDEEETNADDDRMDQDPPIRMMLGGAANTTFTFTAPNSSTSSATTSTSSASTSATTHIAPTAE